MGLETAGYRGWWPMKKIIGRNPDGSFRYQEVYVNMARSREGQVHTRRYETYAPESGWNGEPPYPTGEKPAYVKHVDCGSEEFWQNMAECRHRTFGEVIRREPGRIVILYR